MSRWFEEWARQYRPGTHYTSVTHGLTWQWIHLAHAHLDPIASGEPSIAMRLLSGSLPRDR